MKALDLAPSGLAAEHGDVAAQPGGGIAVGLGSLVEGLNDVGSFMVEKQAEAKTRREWSSIV